MKKLLFVVGVLALTASCTVSRTIQLTGEPIGTKTGKASTSIAGNMDFSIKTAAENGDITVIGAVEQETKSYVIFFKTTTKVYGE